MRFADQKSRKAHFLDKNVSYQTERKNVSHQTNQKKCGVTSSEFGMLEHNAAQLASYCCVRLDIKPPILVKPRLAEETTVTSFGDHTSCCNKRLMGSEVSSPLGQLQLQGHVSDDAIYFAPTLAHTPRHHVALHARGLIRGLDDWCCACLG